MTTARTPIRDTEVKIDLIEHINDEHSEEVLTIARAYGAPEAEAASIKDIFIEGCLLEISTAGNTTPWFIPFSLQGDLEENILYLAYDAMVRQGKPLGGHKKHYFSVLGSELVSTNMLRLRLQSQIPLPEHSAGFAWFFSLKKLSRLPAKAPIGQEKLSKVGQWVNRLFLWWMKQISRKRREKVLQSMHKDLRYYTLRRTEKSLPALPYADVALVDVFLHGATPGSTWAASLKPGDIIHSKAEYVEHTEALHHGTALLIGDETALPTVAAILENWLNPLPPIVISVTNDPADQDYLPDAMLPEGTTLYRISPSTNIADRVMGMLKSLPPIDCVWGALEHHDAKSIRRCLRDEYGLSGKNNRVKAYWKHTSFTP